MLTHQKYSVHSSDHSTIIGADGDDDLGSYSGSAYVFYRNFVGNDLWGEVVKLTAPDGVSEGQFGSEVALDGDIAVVSAPGDDDAGMYSGSVHIFYRNESGADAWGEVAKLTASDAAENDNFGLGVSVYGNTAVIGAFGVNTYAGACYIFKEAGGSWSEQAKLTASDGAPGDPFGLSLAVYGDTAVIGALGDDDSGSASGSAYFFSGAPVLRSRSK